MEHLMTYPTDKLFCGPSHVDSILTVPVGIDKLELVSPPQVLTFELVEGVLEFMSPSNGDLTVHFVTIGLMIIVN
jgi:hypothetical protein